MKTTLADLRVAVIGAGFSGIAAGYHLQRAGIGQFTIFESSAAPGGTWWDNKYPGAEVDTPSHLYSYSFRKYDWSRPYAQHDEIREYLHDTVRMFGLEPHIRLNTEISTATWHSDEAEWELVTASGERPRFDAVITAVGMLNEAYVPALPGIDRFEGRIFHTARWDTTYDVTGKSVAVIGTGSTSTQVVPSIVDRAKHVLVFQRQPSWIDPKPNLPYRPLKRRLLRFALIQRLARLRLFARTEPRWMGARLLKPGTREDRKAVDASRNHLRTVLRDRPDLLEFMEPNVPYQGKRPIRTSEYLPSLLRDNVNVVPQPVDGFVENGVVSEDGTEHQIDLAVMATGFQTTNYLARVKVIGRRGVSLQEYWADEPKAFLGISVPGFPNFFMMYGPNTNFYALVHGFEQQAKYAVRSLRDMIARGGRTVEVDPTYYEVYNHILGRRLAQTSWAIGKNYFKSRTTGRVVTQWPDGAILYTLLTRLLRRPSTRIDHAEPIQPQGEQ